VSENKEAILTKVLSRVGDLPAIPGIVQQVLTLTNDPKSDLGQISDVVQRDPALTAKVLRVSNSSYYGMRQYVGTLKLALVVLGMREIRNISLGIAVFGTLRNETTDAFLPEHFWRHSLETAALCKKLSEVLQLRLQGEDFIAGLLHDMGQLILWRQLGPEYNEVYLKSMETGRELCELERARFGFDHGDAAAALGEQWNLPKTLTDAIWHHHISMGRPIREAKDPRLAAVVRIANRAVWDDLSAPNPELCLSCIDQEAWSEFSHMRELRDFPERYEFLSSAVAEVRAAPSMDPEF
jgi:HD-like signal output (HDOD) protein